MKMKMNRKVNFMNTNSKRELNSNNEYLQKANFKSSSTVLYWKIISQL